MTVRSRTTVAPARKPGTPSTSIDAADGATGGVAVLTTTHCTPAIAPPTHPAPTSAPDRPPIGPSRRARRRRIRAEVEPSRRGRPTGASLHVSDRRR